MNPNCYVIGMKPLDANSLFRSFKSGKAETISIPRTIADSPGPPVIPPCPFGLCGYNVVEIDRVPDQELR